MARRIREWFKDQYAGATVEFVALMPVFLLSAAFAMEASIAIFWNGTAEKAAQLGARLAVVSGPAVAGLPARNALVSTAYAYGSACNTGACTGFNSLTCTGGSGGACDTANFNAIVARMSAIWSQIQAQHVSVTYSFIGLGHAGGPIVPGVTVTLSGVPLGGVMTSIFGNFFPGLTTLPPVSVTLTGEDLSSAGAS
jgi:Flp pilus assembly protein TadG